MGMHKRGRKNEHCITIDALNGSGPVLHAFTTRANGLGDRSRGVKTSDDWYAVAEEFGINAGRVVTVNQVHGENIVKADSLNYQDLRTAHADAIITDVRGLAIGIETADCVPILLLDPAKPAIGAVHAGWKSTVKKIVQKTVNRMSEEFGAEPSRMVAAIGPAIGPECYEVDEPVMGRVREAFSFWKDVASLRGNGRWSLDLVKANRLELLQIGLAEKNIYSVGICTSCRKDLFYSYRAEGRTGRMLSAIMIKT
ncbi:MAG TPA: peptidoglycan editing factor PgeF [Nitrospirota bacterium]